MGRAQAHGPNVHLNEALAGGEVDVQAQWSETNGTITLSPWGRCDIEATATALVLRIDSPDEEHLRRIQGIVTRDLDRFIGGEKLSIDWRRTDAAPNAATGEGPRT